MKIKSSLCLALAFTLASPTVALAQFSDSYNFLKAVRDKDGGKVTEITGKPGSTIVNTRDRSTGETALHIVTQRRDVAWLDFMIAKGANPNLTDNEGTTPLMLATRLRFVEGAEKLIAGGAQVDKTNNSGETPLIRAVQMRDMPLIRLLVSKGANPNKADALAGMSARDYAVRDGRSQAIIDILDSADKKAKPKGPVQGPVF
ncbi:MAG: ankyrin repeat domain-containing protein [Sphingobium sp.]|nr:ankyrin repeat domain-containing protein [Sphingobium sp.]MCP5400624.1 ankyrin repeat domain-containing protein [Sphingomonas sp.]